MTQPSARPSRSTVEQVAGTPAEPATASDVAVSRLGDEVRYRLLRLLQDNPQMTQRELSAALGMSLGKLNYCLNALVARGLVKVRNFRNSRNKAGYSYLLTARGIEEKARVTLRFLRARMAEYDALAREIERLRAESGVAAPGTVAGTNDQ
jgi:EPS-associated MarR family transcriptional regulator